ncbi:MAG: hypothetical protein EOO20_26250 [Chryseobacterium sp.]|nr:MAG: hypothetical protein EOO20_26250 [Chryseobacterium sp.]
MVENIFKHGIVHNPEHPAVLSIYVFKEILSINSKNIPGRSKLIPSQNTGLSNIKQRLMIAYSDKASFLYGMQNEYFIVSINVNLNS